jgi:hypothetical protein
MTAVLSAFGSGIATALAAAGRARWPNVLLFEKNLEEGLIQNDSSFGWAASVDVRDKWQQAPKVAGTRHFSGRTPATTTRSVASTVGAQSVRRSCQPAK